MQSNFHTDGVENVSISIHKHLQSVNAGRSKCINLIDEIIGFNVNEGDGDYEVGMLYSHQPQRPRKNPGIIWYILILNDIIWYYMVLYDIIWYDIIWYCMILYDTVWYYMILYDIIWYYMVLYGIKWYQKNIERECLIQWKDYMV